MSYHKPQTTLQSNFMYKSENIFFLLSHLLYSHWTWGNLNWEGKNKATQNLPNYCRFVNFKSTAQIVSYMYICSWSKTFKSTDNESTVYVCSEHKLQTICELLFFLMINYRANTRLKMDTEGIYKVHTLSDKETHEETKYPTNNSAQYYHTVLPHTGVVSPIFSTRYHTNQYIWHWFEEYWIGT